MVRATFRARRNCWPVGPADDVVGGDLSRPAGPGWGSGWPVGPGVGLRCGGSPDVTPGAGNDRSFSWGGLPPVGTDGCWCGSRRSGPNRSSSGPTGQPFSQPGSQALGASPPRSVRPNGPTVLRNRWGNADEILARWGMLCGGDRRGTVGCRCRLFRPALSDTPSSDIPRGGGVDRGWSLRSTPGEPLRSRSGSLLRWSNGEGLNGPGSGGLGGRRACGLKATRRPSRGTCSTRDRDTLSGGHGCSVGLPVWIAIGTTPGGGHGGKPGSVTGCQKENQCGALERGPWRLG